MGRFSLLYDGGCGFCSRAMRRILAWDRHGRLRAVSLDDPEAAILLASLTPEARPASWHLVSPEGRVWSGGAAVAPLARLLPGGRPIAAVAAAFPKTTDRAYAWVARHRSRLGPPRSWRKR